MANCTKCGNKAGMGKKLCQTCAEQERIEQQRIAEEQAAAEQQKRAEQQRQAEEAARKAEEARRQRYEAFIQERFARLEQLLAQGVTPYLYDDTTISSHSYFNESPNPSAWTFQTKTDQMGVEPDLRLLQSLGWDGWEVIGTVPITFGSTLYNNSGGNTIFAAAYGGMVVGARILLRKPITRQSLVDSRAEIIERLTPEFPG